MRGERKSGRRGIEAQECGVEEGEEEVKHWDEETHTWRHIEQVRFV